MSEKIVVTLSTFAEWDETPRRSLQESGYLLAFNPTGKRITRDLLLELGHDATVAIAGVEPYDASTLAEMPLLRCISRVGVGVDSIDLAAARERGIAVLNTPEPPAAAVAELALTMMLGLVRRLPQQMTAARAHEWMRMEAGLLGAKTVGIVGLGRIGRRVAQLVRAVGATVLAADPAADRQWAEANSVRIRSLPDLLAASDVVSVHASGRSGGARLLGPDELDSMKRGAILINLARGGLVDEQALFERLQSGQLSGAGLDVFEDEPYVGPLCDLENVILTPHSATLTVETRTAMERESVDKVLRFLCGEIRPQERVD